MNLVAALRAIALSAASVAVLILALHLLTRVAAQRRKIDAAYANAESHRQFIYSDRCSSSLIGVKGVARPAREVRR